MILKKVLLIDSVLPSCPLVYNSLEDTTSIGVIIIHIHRGIGLKKMDSRESSGE